MRALSRGRSPAALSLGLATPKCHLAQVWYLAHIRFVTKHIKNRVASLRPFQKNEDQKNYEVLAL